VTSSPGRANPVLSRLRWELRTLAGTQPWLTDLLVRRSGNRISGETQIVIEGFPRTGNTFAVVAFSQAQRKPVSVAHHVHLPSMVKRAVALDVPCIVLVRPPEDTVLSLAVRLPYLSVRQALRSYLRFYEPLLPLLRRFVIGPFAEVTSDFGAVIDRVNRRYGAAFDRFEHTPQHEQDVLEEVDRWDRGAFRGEDEAFERSRARPSDARPALKEARRSDYEADGLWSLHLRAERVHDAFERTWHDAVAGA